MASKPERIIIDTNLWISFLLSDTFSRLDKFLLTGKSRLLFSQELLDEFMTVAERPKFRKYFTSSDLHSLLSVIDMHADFINVESTVNVCRDKKDNFLLALAKDGAADFLITGDSDLLVLKKFEKTRIITFPGYLSRA